MFRGLPRAVRQILAMPTLVAVAVMATTSAPGVRVAGCRVRQGYRSYYTDAPWAD